MNRKLLATILTSVTLSLTACGGGSSSSSFGGVVSVDPSGSFSGERSSAAITGGDTGNYKAFLTALLGTKDLQDISLRDETASNSSSSNSIRDFLTISTTAIQPLASNVSYQNRATPVSNISNCTNGGTIASNGTLDDVTRVGNLVMTFNNCIEGTLTINGSSEIVVRHFDFSKNLPDSYILKTQNLSVTNGADTYTTTAVYDVVADYTAGTSTFTINALNTANGVETLYENLQLVNSPNGVLITGRMYTQADGYVEITSGPLPLYYSFAATYPSTGDPIVLVGENSNIRITPIADETIQIELDLNGDGIYDSLLIIDADGNSTTTGTIAPPTAPNAR